MELLNVTGMPKQREWDAMPFGRRIEHYPKLAAFKASAKRIHVSQKRQSYRKAIKDALTLHEAKEFYCSFQCSPQCKDDSFEVWVK